MEICVEVRKIETKDTYPARQEVLRPGRPLETCFFEGDDLEQTFHLGAIIDEKIVSVASFYLEAHPDIANPFQFRLRGMATLEAYRGKGIACSLLKAAYPLILKNHVHLLWCHARSEAVGFYDKMGFQTQGEEFEIPDVGPHFLMLNQF